MGSGDSIVMLIRTFVAFVGNHCIKIRLSSTDFFGSLTHKKSKQVLPVVALSTSFIDVTAYVLKYI